VGLDAVAALNVMASSVSCIAKDEKGRRCRKRERYTLVGHNEHWMIAAAAARPTTSAPHCVRRDVMFHLAGTERTLKIGQIVIVIQLDP